MKPEVKLAKKKSKNISESATGKPQLLDENNEGTGQIEHARIRTIEDRRNAPRRKRILEARCTRVFVDTKHRANIPWPKEDPDRRLIARFDFTDKGLDGRRILTNFKSYTAEQLYKMYCSRAESEKWIGETKNCFQLRFNSQSFNANQFRLLIHAHWRIL